MSFFNELKRRSVVKIGVAYAIFAWLVLQIIDTVLPNLGAPQWVVSTLMVIILLGFPITLILAWAFEMTPDGIKTQQAADDADYQPTGNKLNALIIGVMALVILFLAVDNYVLDDITAEAPATIASTVVEEEIFDGEITQTTAEEKSIAVLPFANLSSDPEQEYFADGLSEELLNKLARVQDLQVAGRTSSFFYKGKNEDLRVIGETLGVAHILEGSVRKSGNNVRITAQLIKADDGFHLWSETFDRELTEIFAIQDEIAEAVTSALAVTLGAGEFNRPGMTRNVVAYDSLMKGWAVMQDEGFVPLQAADFFQEAVSLDPDFGLAWLSLGNVYFMARGGQSAAEGSDYGALAIEAILKARANAPEMPELLTSTAGELRSTHDWAGAETVLLQLLEEYGTSMGEVNRSYGAFLRAVGRLEESVFYLERARRLDPLNASYAQQLSTTYLNLGRLAEAEAEADRGISLGQAATTVFLTGNKIYIALLEGDWESALDRMSGEVVWETAYGPNLPKGIDVARNFAQGNNEAGLRDMKAMLDSGLSPIFNTAIAPLAVLGGDTELALQFQTRQANPNLNDIFGSVAIWTDFYAGMRQMEGFKDIAREAGLVDYWRTTGNWADKCRPLEGGDDFECF